MLFIRQSAFICVALYQSGYEIQEDGTYDKVQKRYSEIVSDETGDIEQWARTEKDLSRPERIV